jgi:hypothetical protein
LMAVAVVWGCQGPGTADDRLAGSGRAVPLEPAVDQRDWRADPRGMELAQVLRFHALGQPQDLLYYFIAGVDEVYRLEIERTVMPYRRLVVLVLRKGERVELAVHRLRVEWFGEASECIRRWRTEFADRCPVPETPRPAVARELSASEWAELQAKIAATRLWTGQSELGESCAALDGTWFTLEGRREEGSGDLHGCAEVASPLRALARYLIERSGVEFEI